MKILVFGAGRIGAAVVWDLAKVDSVETIGLVDKRKDVLENTKSWIKSAKIVIHNLDITNKEETERLMKQYDVGITALPDRKTSYSIMESAIKTGINIVDMLEEYHRRPDAYELEGLEVPTNMKLEEYGEFLHKKAVENKVFLLDGMGFAPGLSNITIGEGIRKMDKAMTAVARVGGIPSKQASSKHPLKYMITWAFQHVLREYMVKVKVIRDGKVVELDATCDQERFRFRKFGVDEELECAVTPGMPSLIYTHPELLEFSEKTIRWPGHWDGVRTLKECGLFDLTPFQHKGHEIVPREFLLTVIEPRLRANQGDTDVCVMWNTVTGIKDGKRMRIDYYMWEEADTLSNISAMARVTGFPASVAAILVHTDGTGHKGIVPPEDFIPGKLYTKFMNELKKRNITILEEQTPGLDRTDTVKITTQGV